MGKYHKHTANWMKYGEIGLMTLDIPREIQPNAIHRNRKSLELVIRLLAFLQLPCRLHACYVNMRCQCQLNGLTPRWCFWSRFKLLTSGNEYYWFSTSLNCIWWQRNAIDDERGGLWNHGEVTEVISNINLKKTFQF